MEKSALGGPQPDIFTLLKPTVECVAWLGGSASTDVWCVRRGGQLMELAVGTSAHPLIAGEACAPDWVIRRNIEHFCSPLFARVWEIGCLEGRWFVFQEHIEGCRVAKVLEERACRLDLFLRIAHDLARALVALNQRGVGGKGLLAHRAILDANGQVRILNYTHEQTGHAPRRTMDSRGEDDLRASAGVVRTDVTHFGELLYHWLRGPLKGQDDSTLGVDWDMIHAAVGEAEGDVRATLVTRLIGRAMGIEEDSRYRNLLSLKLDLGQLRKLLQTPRATGQLHYDVADLRFQCDDVTLAQWWPLLEDMHGHAGGGRGEAARLIFVRAPTGRGKTSFLKTFLQQCTEGGKGVLWGRCTSVCGQPMGVLRDAWTDHLLSQTRGADAHSCSHLRRAQHAFAATGEGLDGVFLHPEESEATSTNSSPREPSLLSTGTLVHCPDTNHAAMVEELLVRLTQGEQPLVIALDDAERLDEASLEVLRRLMNRRDKEGLVLVLSVADQETQDQLGKQFRLGAPEVQVAEIALPKMTIEGVGQYLQAYLGSMDLDPLLEERFFQHSQGLALNVGQMLRTAIQQGALLPHWGRIRMDVEHFARQGTHHSLGAVLEARVRQTHEETREFLLVAALIGQNFQLRMVKDVVGSRLLLGAALGDALRVDLIEPQGRGMYRFVLHETLALLQSEAGPERVQAIHGRLVEYLEKVRTPTRPQLYSLAEHLYAGCLFTAPEKVLKANIQAAACALEDGGIRDSEHFLNQALEAWTQLTSPTGDAAGLLHYLWGLCKVKSHQLSQAKTYFDQSIQLGCDPLLQAEAYLQIADIYGGRYEFHLAHHNLKLAFHLLGAPYPQGGKVALLRDYLLWRSGWKSPPRRCPRGEVASKRWCRIMAGAYDRSATIAYYQMTPGVLFESVLKGRAVAAHLGSSQEYVVALTSVGLALAAAGQKRKALCCLAEAQATSDVVGTPECQARVGVGVAVIHTFLGETDVAEEALRRNQRYSALLTPWLMNASHTVAIQGALLQGRMQQARENIFTAKRQLTEAGLSETKDKAFFFVYQLFELQTGSWLEKREEVLDSISLLHRQLNRSLMDPYSCARFDMSAAFCFMYEDEASVEPYVESFLRSQISPARSPFFLRVFYVVWASLRCRQWQEANRNDKELRLQGFQKALKALQACAQVPALQAHALWLEGAMWIGLGYRDKAEKCLSDALDYALKARSPWVLFEVWRLRAREDMGSQSHKPGGLAAQQALSVAHSEGWACRERDLLEEFPGLHGSMGMLPTQGGGSDTMVFALRRQVEALSEIGLRCVRIQDPKGQIDLALESLLELVQAERAVFFQVEDGILTTLASQPLDGGETVEEREHGTSPGYCQALVDDAWRLEEGLITALYYFSGGHKKPQREEIYRQELSRGGLKTAMATPLIVGEGVRGVLYVDSTTRRSRFAQPDLESLKVVSSLLLVFLDNMRAWEVEVERRNLEKQAGVLAQKNRELSLARQAAVQASELKTRFLANMSHEIRTPMNGVLGMISLMRSTPLSGEQSDYLGVIDSSATALLHILDDVLDLSKIEAGRLIVEREPFDLEAVWNDVLTLLWGGAQQKGVALVPLRRVMFPGWVVGDSLRVRQVLLNLVGNAIKFTQGGHVALILEDSKDQEDQWLLTFCVEDTGIGIPQERLCAIFEAFEQANSSTTRQFGGTGLGLAITRQLVTTMGGTIRVESQEGEGTRFHVTLPLGKHGNAADAQVESMHGRTAHNEVLKVALALPPGAVRESLKWELTHRGHSVLAEPEDEKIPGLHYGETRSAAFDAPTGIGLGTLADELDLVIAPWARVIADDDMPGRTPRSPGLVAFVAPSDLAPAQGALARGLLAAVLVEPLRTDSLDRCLAAIRAAGSGNSESPEMGDNQDCGGVETSPSPPTVKAILQVLVVEDNAMNQKLIGKVLEKMQCKVTIAANGQVALDVIAEGCFDLVLMDCQMPVLDGYEATRQMRLKQQKGEIARVPIVAMTANAMKGDRERCLAAGMDEYLTKPIRMDELKRVLEEVRQGGYGSRRGAA